jgi:predicted MFS family arabinose efflux permease
MFRSHSFHPGMKREAILLFIAIAFIGLSQGFSENIWTNYYNVIGMQTADRTLLEPIREMPGLLMMFIIAALSFLTLGRMGAVAMLTRAGGLLALAFFVDGFNPVFLGLMVVISLGDHIFMPLRNSIGITVAQSGREGRVIGMMDATAMVLYLVASVPILFFFSGKQIQDYRLLFYLAAGAAVMAGLALSGMRTRKSGEVTPKTRLVFERKFWLYYLISFISGLRKQIYLVFAPWLLVKIFSQPLQAMTLLNIVGAVTIFFFNPFMGHLIDKHGERKLLVGGGMVATVIYVAYAFLCTGSPDNSALVLVLFALSYVDRLSQSTLMGRDVFVKHTAANHDEIMPTLSAGVSMDHIASVVSPMLGGLLWTTLGAQWVFVAGALIAVVYTAMCMLVPGKRATVGHDPSV